MYDYYVYLDYSENLVGYLIINKDNVENVISKTRKFKHYREPRDKRVYLKHIKKTAINSRLVSCFARLKIKERRDNIIIYSDIFHFLNKYNGLSIHISVDDHEYSNFIKFVMTLHFENIIIKKESELKFGTVEHKLSLVLDNFLNIERLKHTG